MSTRRTNLLKEAREYVNYVDVLSLALAYTKMSEFVGYDGHRKWYEAAHELYLKFNESVSFLRQIFFEHRPGGFVYSGEIEQWLSVLSMAGLIDKFAYGAWRMSDEQRAHIIRGRAEKLIEFEVQIQEMAEIFRRFLKP